jgi:hypothetical protein
VIDGSEFAVFIIFEMLMIGWAFKIARTEAVHNIELNTSKFKYKFNATSGFILLLAYLVFIIFLTFIKIDVGVGGNDAIVYKLRFENANIPLFQSLKLQGNEYGYGFLIWVLRRVSSNYKIVLFTIFSVTFCSIIYFVKHIKWTIYTVLSYSMILILVLSGICLIRNILSVSIGMLIYIMLYEKKYIKSFIFAALAVSVHSSAIILFPLIIMCVLLDNQKLSMKRLSVYMMLNVGLIVVLMIVASRFVGATKYSIYSADEGVALATYLMYIVVLFLGFYRYKNLVASNPFNRTLLISLTTGLFCLVLQLKYSIAYRMLLFYQPIMFALVPGLMEEYNIFSFRKNGAYFLINLGLFAYLILILYKFLTAGAISYGLYPYINTFF